jgi:hypothetical protein
MRPAEAAHATRINGAMPHSLSARLTSTHQPHLVSSIALLFIDSIKAWSKRPATHTCTWRNLERDACHHTAAVRACERSWHGVAAREKGIERRAALFWTV